MPKEDAEGFGKGYKNENSYVTCQLSVTKELRRTGEPFKP